MQQQHKSPCPQCGQVHDEDLEALADLAASLAEQFTDEAFPVIWKEAKQDIKEMGKRDIAQTRFFTGATQMLAAFMRMSHHVPPEE